MPRHINTWGQLRGRALVSLRSTSHSHTGSPATFLVFFSSHRPASPVSTRRIPQLKSENSSGRNTCNTNGTCGAPEIHQLYTLVFLSPFEKNWETQQHLLSQRNPSQSHHQAGRVLVSLFLPDFKWMWFYSLPLFSQTPSTLQPSDIPQNVICICFWFFASSFCSFVSTYKYNPMAFVFFSF